MSEGTRAISHAVRALSVVFWAGIVYYAIELPIAASRFGVAFLGGAVLIYFLGEVEESDRRSRVALAALALASIVVTLYVFFEFQTLENVRVGFNTPLDYVLAAVMLVTVVYGTYRSYGIVFVAVVIAVVVYAYFGPLFPAWARHAGLDAERILQMGVLNISGIYGNLTRLMGTWIALFLLYAAFIQAYGGLAIVIRAARRMARYTRSGVAQTAVVASMAIGSINGSATANTAITGSITIDLMKERGIKSETAAAIEAVASSGGQILPPVMGAAAFFMASLLSISYVDVLVAGVLPAVLFYVPVALSVHYSVLAEIDSVGSSNQGDAGGDEALPGSRKEETGAGAIAFVIPFLILLFTLGVLRYNIMYAALFTNAAMVAAGILFPAVRARSWRTIVRGISMTLDGVERGARSTAPLAVVIASIGFIVDILLTTGIPSKLSLAIVAVSGGALLPATALTLGVAIVLGMGMPTGAAYLLVAILLAPTLVSDLAIPALSAHYFVFYAALLSALTPPIAVGIVVASGLANADFWHTVVRAFRIGFPLYLLPFVFVYHPEIVSDSISIARFVTLATALWGMIALAYAVNAPLDASGWSGALGRRGAYGVLGLVALFSPGVVVRMGALFVITTDYLIASRRAS